MELERLGAGEYPARITELRNSPRVDVEVDGDPLDVDQVVADIVGPLRNFFDQIEQAAQARKGDPVAMAHAFARVEALEADLRFVRDTIRTLLADALHDAQIRRLTVAEIATVEGVGSVDRTNWEHRKLMIRMFYATENPFGARGYIDPDTGDFVTVETIVDTLLGWFTPNWRLTPIREAGLNPDDFCDVKTGDDGKPVRTPSVKVVDNIVRRLR